MKLKLLLPIGIVSILFLTFVGCSEDIYEKKLDHHGTNKNAISFKKFKQQTKIKDFSTLRSFDVVTENNREIRDEYLIDTLTIMYFASPLGKDTYSFKIYPITKELNSKEYFNLVYEKNGNEWYQHIFKNTEKENPQYNESRLESSEMIYSSRQAHFSISYLEACQFIQADFHCTNTGACAEQGFCDGCDLCVTVTVTYFPCPTSGSGGSGSGGIAVGDPSGGTSSGIYIPNPYNGEEDLNNPEFVFAMQVAEFTRSLPNSPINLKDVVNSRSWIYPSIVDFMRNNGGLTQENKDSVIAVLSKFHAVMNYQIPSNATFEEIEQFQYWAFKYFLNNPNVTLIKFTNWFMTPREGKDGDYDEEFWEDPELTFPQQNLPSLSAFTAAYPPAGTSGASLIQQIGGAVQQAYTDYPNNIRGYCALKVSRGLNGAGINIPNLPNKTIQGGDGKYYFLNAKALNKWMRKTFGIAPSNPNHLHFTADQGGPHGENFPLLLDGYQGIYSMVVNDPNHTFGSGHADLLQSNGECVFGCQFSGVPDNMLEYIDVWILSN